MINDPKPSKGIYDYAEQIKETSILRHYDKEKEDNKENEEKNDEGKIEKGTNKSDEKNKKNIQNNKEIKKTNIILNILNKPFFCCWKS